MTTPKRVYCPICNHGYTVIGNTPEYCCKCLVREKQEGKAMEVRQQFKESMEGKNEEI